MESDDAPACGATTDAPDTPGASEAPDAQNAQDTPDTNRRKRSVSFANQEPYDAFEGAIGQAPITTPHIDTPSVVNSRFDREDSVAGLTHPPTHASVEDQHPDDDDPTHAVYELSMDEEDEESEGVDDNSDDGTTGNENSDGHASTATNASTYSGITASRSSLATSLASLPRGLLQTLLAGGKLGRKPVHAAARRNDVAKLEELLGDGGEYEDDVDDTDPFDYTPLHAAAEAGAAEAAEYLVTAGADVEATTKLHNSRPLHYACFEGYPPVCRVLLEGGADLDPRTDDRRTPLFQAAFRGHDDCVRMLLTAGADRSVKTLDGRTACDVALYASTQSLFHEPPEKRSRTE